MKKWDKKGFWKIIDSEMWYYRGYRANVDNANSLTWDIRRWENLMSLKQYNPEKGIYEIFVRPREEDNGNIEYYEDVPIYTTTAGTW